MLNWYNFTLAEDGNSVASVTYYGEYRKETDADARSLFVCTDLNQPGFIVAVDELAAFSRLDKWLRLGKPSNPYSGSHRRWVDNPDG